MARCIDQVQLVALAVTRGVLERGGLRLDRDAAFTLEVHRIEDLRLHLAVRQAATALDQAVEKRNQAVPSLEREPLLCRVLGGEIALEAFRHRQLPQNVAARVWRGVLSHPARLEPVVQPEALGRIRHMRELGANRSAVDVPDLREDVAQRKPRLDRVVAAAGVELEIEVRLRQLVILEVEDAWPRPDHEAERIDVRNQVASVHVGLDQARNRSLLRACVVPVGRRCRRCGAGS